MTAHPIPENHDHWWLTTRAAWRKLHAVHGVALTDEQVRDAIDAGEPIRRRTACRRTLNLAMGGLVSRLGMPRCGLCCNTLGIPSGFGTPANENYRQDARGPWRTAGGGTGDGVQVRSTLGRVYIRQGNQTQPVLEIGGDRWVTVLADALEADLQRPKNWL